MSEVDDKLVSEAEVVARELRCYVTNDRCRDYGCRHDGATVMPADWRCAACKAYEFLLQHYPR